MRMLLFVILL